MREKPNIPSSCLRWIPTGRIFKTGGLRWIPTGNMFTDKITKVDSEPSNGLNEDITNPYECKQSLDVSAGTLKLSAGTSVNLKKEGLIEWLVQNSVSPTPYVPPSKKDYEIMFQQLFDEYFNPSPRAVSSVLAAIVAPRVVDQPVHLYQLPLIKMYHLLVLHQQLRKFNLKSLIKVPKNKFMDIKIYNLIMHPSFIIFLQTQILKKQLYKGSFHQICIISTNRLILSLS
nr:hypothetical protein [Tanacetum cinerariifolium]